MSKVEIAHRYIQQRIADGRFVSGYRLVLGQLAEDLDMSVVPVREAIRMLEAEGLVTYERNVGAQVALVHDDEYRVTMETLSIVEGAATGFAAPLITGDQIARARAVNDQMRASVADLDPRHFTELNREFHAVLFEACPNPHLLDLVHNGWRRLALLRESIFGFVPDRARSSVDEHEALLRLIESKADPLEIELSARAHRRASLDALMERLHPAENTATPASPPPSAPVYAKDHR